MSYIHPSIQTYALLAIVFRLYKDAWQSEFAAGGFLIALIAFAAWSARSTAIEERRIDPSADH